MSTTPGQKAMILDIWRTVREKRGETVDIQARIRWNWPSLTDDEMREVWKTYETRREKMPKTATGAPYTDRPRVVSSPKFPPKHHLRCELGCRKYTEAFANTTQAKVFLNELLKGEAVTWENDEVLSAKGGVLKVQCAELRDVMDFEPSDEWAMPDNMVRQLTAFLRGRWDNRSHDMPVEVASVKAVRDKAAAARAVLNGSGGLTTLAQVCAQQGWEPRDVRQAMRKAKWEKPADGWAWKVVPLKKLQELMR